MIGPPTPEIQTQSTSCINTNLVHTLLHHAADREAYTLIHGISGLLAVAGQTRLNERCVGRLCPDLCVMQEGKSPGNTAVRGTDCMPRFSVATCMYIGYITDHLMNSPRSHSEQPLVGEMINHSLRTCPFAAVNRQDLLTKNERHELAYWRYNAINLLYVLLTRLANDILM